VSEP
jgi:SigmaW regulon antibacterial